MSEPHVGRPKGTVWWNSAIWGSRGCACRRSGSAATISAGASISPRRKGSCTRRSTSASPFLTRPTPMATRAAIPKPISAGSSGDRRKDIVLATKFARPMDGSGRFEGASRRYIMAEVEASLRRLQTDWIDLYQQHQPDPLDPDRGNPARARRPRMSRQGALPRLLDLGPPGRWSRRNGPRAITGSTISSRARRSTACWRAASTPR